MKVLIINNNNSIVGGNDAAALNQFALFRNKSLETFFFSRNTFNSTFELGNKLSFVKYFYNKDAKKSLQATINEFTPSIIHIHSFSGIVSNSLLSVLKNNNVKSVMTIHDYKLICPVSSCLSHTKLCTKCAEENNPKNVIFNKCNRNSMLYSGVNYLDYKIANDYFNQRALIDNYIFVSKFSAQLHYHFFPHLKNKSQIIPNFFTPQTKDRLLKESYLLYIGRLSAEKGILQFVNRFTKHKNLALSLLVAGDGPLKSQIEQIAMNDHRIKLLGFIKGDEKERLISKAKYVVLPSQWYENNPISLIESLALGTPVLASNIGGIPEIVEDNKNGFLFEAFNDQSIDSVLYKINNVEPQVYMNLVSNAFEKYYKEYTQDIFFKRTTDLYEKILS